MLIDKALNKILRAESTITAEVGTRIYNELATQGGATPYLVTGFAAEQPTYHMMGNANYTEARASITVVADTAKKVSEVVEIIKTYFRGAYVGLQSDTSIYIQSIMIDSILGIRRSEQSYGEPASKFACDIVLSINYEG